MNGDGEHAGESAADTARGRDAARPADIPQAGWWDIFKRVLASMVRDNVSLVSAGLSMYALLSIFPLVTAAVSVYALFGDPARAMKSTGGIGEFVPTGAWDLFARQLQDAASHPRGTLTGAAAIALGISLWSARAGMASLIKATNVAYSERETRGFLHRFAVSGLLAAGGIIGLLTMLLLSIGAPVALQALGISTGKRIAVGFLRWLLIWVFSVSGLAIIYRYGPCRAHAQWRWVTWGSGVAATLWVGGSLLYALYVRTFGAYGKTYGALGDMVVLLLWLYLSSFTIVLGAEINAEMERQTERDTTDGPEKPLGQRGAHAADTIGPSTDHG